MNMETNVYQITGTKGAEMILKSPGDYVIVTNMLKREEILHEYPEKHSKNTVAHIIQNIRTLTYYNEKFFGRICYQKGDLLCSVLFAL